MRGGANSRVKCGPQTLQSLDQGYYGKLNEKSKRSPTYTVNSVVQYHTSGESDRKLWAKTNIVAIKFTVVKRVLNNQLITSYIKE